jgi:hypothetical protein
MARHHAVNVYSKLMFFRSRSSIEDVFIKAGKLSPICLQIHWQLLNGANPP